MRTYTCAYIRTYILHIHIFTHIYIHTHKCRGLDSLSFLTGSKLGLNESHALAGTPNPRPRSRPYRAKPSKP